jgi:hypothetical protein
MAWQRDILMLVTSEFLSLYGIQNHIVVANRHALNLAVDSENDMARILNPSRNSLNGAWNSAVLAMPSIHSDLRKLGDELRTLGILRTDLLIQNCPPERRAAVRGIVPDGKEAETWLDIAVRRQHPSLDAQEGVYYQHPELFHKNHAFYGTVTSAEAGRKMLSDYYNFWFLADRKSQHASEYLRDMTRGGVFPEFDRRTLRDHGYFLNEFLERQSTNNLASFVAHLNGVSDNATALTQDLSVKLWRPNWLKRAAMKTHDTEMLRLARDEYSEIYDKRPNSLVAGKLTKATRLISLM